MAHGFNELIRIFTDRPIEYPYLIEACANKSCLKAMRSREIGEAFGVRRSSAAFSALEPENVKLDFNEPFAKCKAEKAALDRRTPKASPASSYLITYNRFLFAHSSLK